MAEFISGLDLAEMFHQEAVKPILESTYPDLAYSAALIGPGSDVLGYDTARSTDHEWGPRMFLFLSEADHLRLSNEISRTLSLQLPTSFHGYSTHFSRPDVTGISTLSAHWSGPVNHKVEILTLERFVRGQIGFYPNTEIPAADWLCCPEQKLLEITAGRVFHDGLAELEPLRRKLAYFPHDVWLYRMAAQWKRIAQQEAFVGRAGDMGDGPGSRLIASDLTRDLMKLCFLIEKHYAPYSKWFGTAFSGLDCAPELLPALNEVLRADDWHVRERGLEKTYELVARRFNALTIAPEVDPATRQFYDRPYRVLFADRFVEAIKEVITDPAVKAIDGWYGAVDQLSDSTDFLGRHEVFRQTRSLYETRQAE